MLKTVRTDNQLLCLVGMVLFNVGRYDLTGYSICESVWKGSVKKKDGKNDSHCYNSKLFQVLVSSSTAMYGC